MPTYNSSSPGDSGITISRTWSNSPKGSPFVSPQPLNFVKRVGLGHKTYGTGSYAQGFIKGFSTFPGGDPLVPARNKALERMRERSDGVTATVGTSIAEYKSSFKMISNRAVQLYSAFSAVKQGRLKKAARLLGIKNGKVPKGVRNHYKAFYDRKDARMHGKVWLEYWMGWAPLVGDVSNAIKVLADDKPLPTQVMTSATDSKKYDDIFTINANDPAWATDYIFDSAVRCTVKVAGQVRLADNHRRAAHRLGLTSPLSTAWELIPWSWFVGWFSNVGTWLDSLNWFRGLEITNSYTTTVMEGHDRYFSKRRRTGVIQYIRYDTTFSCRRTLGWPSYTLVAWDPPSRLSISRAATAISLLVQRLRS